MDKLSSFQENKLSHFFSIEQRESKGKEVKIISNPRFYITNTRKLTNYETAVT